MVILVSMVTSYIANFMTELKLSYWLLHGLCVNKQVERKVFDKLGAGWKIYAMLNIWMNILR